MCVRSARGNTRHEDRTGPWEEGGLRGKGLGKKSVKEGDSPNWQHQAFNFGAVTHRLVPTTPCSQGIQQLMATPHGLRLQEVLCGGCKVTWNCLTRNCAPLWVFILGFYTIKR